MCLNTGYIFSILAVFNYGTCYAWSTQSITIYRMRRSDQDHRHALKLCGRARVFLPSAFAPVLLQTACVA